MKPIGRSGGRSAVAAAAYRTATMMINERDGLVHDFTAKRGVDHVGIVLPDGVEADWALDRSRLWNAMEAAENRCDARVAREFELALPHELTDDRRLALTRAFAQDLANRFGAAVDFAIHVPSGDSDLRNIHAHVLMTTRVIGPDGPGDKTLIERENRWLLNNDHPTSHMQLRDIRQLWEHHANRELARAGLDIRIDHRSHLDRGLEIEPTEHMGVHAAQMQRRGLEVSRGRIEEDAARRNAGLIREQPEQVLTILTGEKSVFDRHDVARTLHRYIDDIDGFANAFAAVMASPELVELQPRDTAELARYSTREMIAIEHAMAESAARLRGSDHHGVNARHVTDALTRQDGAIKAVVSRIPSNNGEASEPAGTGVEGQHHPDGLGDEQRAAVHHVTGPQQIAAVIGFAGAGKSTMLAAARMAWERQGYRVHGGALAGKAAEGLEASSGIPSRTLASWEYGEDTAAGSAVSTLGRNDILVIDEAGMIGSRQLARFVLQAEATGTKLVLVGDHEQLQAIGAGSPFRAIAEQVGAVELSQIRRQTTEWQREASVAFATHRTADGLAAYAARGGIDLAETVNAARAKLVGDYLADLDQHPSASRLALAHRRVDVRAINDGIRTSLQDRGLLAKGSAADGHSGVAGDSGKDGPGTGGNRESTGQDDARHRPEANGEIVYQTAGGSRAFAAGDRIVLLENNRDLDVKNGMLGTVMAVAPDIIDVRLDGTSGASAGHRDVALPVDTYQAFDHGYATTIHKAQGATVDRAFVMASATMDRHLTYVAMTRHRHDVRLYAGQDELSGYNGATLVDHGVAPYEHKAGNRDSYYVTTRSGNGETHTVWGVDLARAMREASPQAGAKVMIEHTGRQAVTLPDGSEVHRNGWRVHTGDAIAMKQLEQRLGRSGLKESTLDYATSFAARRGLEESAETGLQRDLNPEVSNRLEPLPSRGRDTREAPQIAPRMASSPASLPGSSPAVTPPGLEHSAHAAQDATPGAKVEPLVPAVSSYARSVEAIARDEAMPDFERAMQTIHQVGRLVYHDTASLASQLRDAIIDRRVDGEQLAQSLRDHPEQFGPLRGKTGMFGDNSERRQARQKAGALGNHVAHLAQDWSRQFTAAVETETWNRRHRDVVEVPGLTPRSERILAQFDTLESDRQAAFLKQLSTTPEGRQALDEARTITTALSQRFGSSDPRAWKDSLRSEPHALVNSDRIIAVAKLTDRVHGAELSRQYDLTRSLKRGLGLGLGM